jgi:predicted nucleic acid-binding protein
MDSTTPAVVDTDVVSFLFKNQSLAPVYQAILAGRPLSGAARRDLMRRFLKRFTLLLPDTETARAWARTKSGCEKRDRPSKQQSWPH